MGITIEFQDMTAETVKNAIQFALNRSTQNNAKKVSFSFRNRERRPIETAVWWVEHVAATGGIPLAKGDSSLLSWYEYHLIDVYVIVGSVLTVCVIVCAVIVKLIVRVLPTKATGTKNLAKNKIH